MREIAERACFAVCLGLGRLLRSVRYSKVRIVSQNVRKHRVRVAPLLIWLSGPIFRMLGSGVRVLPQRAWEEREEHIYRALRGTSIEVDSEGTLVLPRLPGRTLAAWLEDRALEESVRARAIELAVVALAEFHRLGFTHGDAMAENVLIDLESGVARWFDFETVHDARRPMVWRRADDLRALLATCVVRTLAEKHAAAVRLIADTYGDDDVVRLVAQSFTSVWQRPLAFHLAQAGLSFDGFREIGRLLSERQAKTDLISR